MRGDAEKKALDIIIDGVFCRNGVPLTHPFTGKTYLDATDREFNDDRVWFVNSDCYQSFFGLTEEDRFELEGIIRTAAPNPNSSEFPDFIFREGFIEHFAITSSRTTRNGAIHRKEEQEFIRKVEHETKELQAQWNEEPSFEKVRSKTWIHINPAHCYEYLSESLHLSWEHHCDSLNKYTGPKDIGIFLIEYPETALAMCENVYSGWIDGMAQGDMREQESFKEYRLSRDKELLSFIYHQKDVIKYVLFVNQSRFEVIKTDSIPYLLKLMPWDYVIYPLAVQTVSSLHNISIPKMGGEADE